MKKTWVKIRKELELDESGKFIEKRKTFERSQSSILGFEKKEFIDLVIKFFGLIAIAVPIFLFYLNDKTQKRKERELIQAEVFFKSSSDLYKLINTDQSAKSYSELLESVFYDEITKLRLFGNDNSTLVLKKMERDLKHLPTVDSLVNSYADIREDRFYKSIRIRLRTVKTGIVDGLNLKFDELKLSELSAKHRVLLNLLFELWNNVSDLEISDLDLMESSPDNYLGKYVSHLMDLDSIQNSFLREVSNMQDEITLMKKYPSQKDKDNQKLKTKAEAIYQLNYEQHLLLGELNQLRENHKKYLNVLLDSFNLEFVRTNKILRELNQ